MQRVSSPPCVPSSPERVAFSAETSRSSSSPPATRHGHPSSGTKTAHLDGLAIEWRRCRTRLDEEFDPRLRGADVVFHCAARSPSRATSRRCSRPRTSPAPARDRRGAPPRGCRGSSTPRRSWPSRSPTTKARRRRDRDVELRSRGPGRRLRITKRRAGRLSTERAIRLDAVVVNPTYMFGPLDARPSSGQLIIDV